MNNLIELFGGLGAIAVLIFSAFISIMLILMPLFVWGIYNRIRAMEERSAKALELLDYLAKEARTMRFRQTGRAAE